MGWQEEVNRWVSVGAGLVAVLRSAARIQRRWAKRRAEHKFLAFRTWSGGGTSILISRQLPMCCSAPMRGKVWWLLPWVPRGPSVCLVLHIIPT